MKKNNKYLSGKMYANIIDIVLQSIQKMQRYSNA